MGSTKRHNQVACFNFNRGFYSTWYCRCIQSQYPCQFCTLFHWANERKIKKQDHRRKEKHIKQVQFSGIHWLKVYFDSMCSEMQHTYLYKQLPRYQLNFTHCDHSHAGIMFYAIPFHYILFWENMRNSAQKISVRNFHFKCESEKQPERRSSVAFRYS